MPPLQTGERRYQNIASLFVLALKDKDSYTCVNGIEVQQEDNPLVVFTGEDAICP